MGTFRDVAKSPRTPAPRFSRRWLVTDVEAVEVTFGSERILSREHAALEQASQIARGYTFVDALADQKAFLESLAAELGRSARGLLPRIADGTLRFRLLRKMPSNENLYLLASDSSYRVITGSANLSLAALSGRHQEVFILFDGESAYSAFEEYYRRDAGEAAAVPADCLIVPAANGEPPQPRSTPIPINEVPCVPDAVERSGDCRRSAQGAIERIDRQRAQSCEHRRCAASWTRIEYGQGWQDGYHRDLVLSCIQGAQDRAG